MIVKVVGLAQVMTKKVVILGGTTEARKLANLLVETYGNALCVVSSLAGRTTNPRLPKGGIREGGFGGVEGLTTYLRDVKPDLLIDATHPYAAQISAHAVEAAKTTNTPHIMLLRPAWVEEDSDHWVHVPDITTAVQEISRRSDACLITTGINDVAAFTPIITTKLFVRLIEAPKNPLPIPDAEIIIGTPPYKKDDEVALFRLLGIDLIVSKNAGGDGTVAKIQAARTLGIKVIMIDRPAMPDCVMVGSVEDAFAHAQKTVSLN